MSLSSQMAELSELMDDDGLDDSIPLPEQDEVPPKPASSGHKNPVVGEKRKK